MSQQHHNYKWSRLSKQRRAIAQLNDEVCEACRKPFDWTLHPNNLMGCTVSHPVALAYDGELLPPLDELGVRHRACHGHEGAAISNLKQGTGAGSRGGNPDTYSNNKHKARTTTRRLRLVAEINSETREPAPSSFPTQHSTPPIGKLVSPRGTPGSMQLPRLMSPESPNAVGSLGDEWISWLGANTDIKLRPWQEFVFRKALEVDSLGKFVWREVGISTPRQVGKTWMIRALALARCSLAASLGEPQQVAHLANNVEAAMITQRLAWHWAAENGVEKWARAGDERLQWGDGSVWFLSSLRAIYGRSAHMALVDEVWDVAEADISQGVHPITVARANSQLWLFSTANAKATSLFLKFRKRALEGKPGVLLIEWSAPAGADMDDPAVWEAASPWWDAERERLIASQDDEARRYQYCNQWPGDDKDLGWPEGFMSCPTSPDKPPVGAVGAVEVSQDRRRAGAAIAASDGRRVAVWSYAADDVESAVEWLNRWEPVTVLAGVSIKPEVEVSSVSWVRAAGTSESRLATPLVASLVERGELAHDHSEWLLGEHRTAEVTLVESGPLLSAKRSRGPIPVLKALLWAVLESRRPVEEPGIYA